MTLKQIKQQANQLFRFCLVDGAVDDSRAHVAVNCILRDRRRGYRMLLKNFMRLLRLDCATHTADVESAVPLATDLRTEIEARIQHAYGRRVRVLFRQNAGLIGGMRMTIGSDVYDGSIQFRLAALEKSFGITNGRIPSDLIPINERLE